VSLEDAMIAYTNCAVYNEQLLFFLDVFEKPNLVPLPPPIGMECGALTWRKPGKLHA